MIGEVKEVLNGTGIKVAGWIITGTIVVIGAAYIYTQYLEMRKLKVDYQISQYELQQAIKNNPEFKPKKS